MLFLGSVLVIFTIFVLTNVPFGVLDLTGWPQALVKYKIQDEKKVPVRARLGVVQPFILAYLNQVNWSTYRKTIKVTFFNGVVTANLFQLAMYPLSAMRVSCTLPLPPVTKVIWDLLICVIAVEILFYYTHR